MPYCPFCGSEASEEDTFCRSCGAVLSGSSLPPQRPKDDGKMTKIIAVAVVMAIMFAAVGGVVMYYLFDFTIKSDYNNTYRWTYDGQSFSYELTVDSAYYSKVTGSSIDRGGSLSAERYTTAEGVQVAVKDYIVVDDHIQELADSLLTQYKQAFGADPNEEQYVKFAATFVNVCIEYDWDEANNGDEYWRYPLQTLMDRTGDCEDTSILLAAILDAAGYHSGIILLPGHAMCAISAIGIPELTYPNKKHSDVYMLEYYPIETTAILDEKIIGYMGDNYQEAYPHLYMGYATEYY